MQATFAPIVYDSGGDRCANDWDAGIKWIRDADFYAYGACWDSGLRRFANGLGRSCPCQASRPRQILPNPLTDPTVKPGKVLLLTSEARFAKDVLAAGWRGFASWFADDGVALGNGQPPAIGRVAIAKSANWDPKAYQLTWTPTDAQMGPPATWAIHGDTSKDTARMPPGIR